MGVGTLLRSPPRGLHALDWDSPSYSPWEEGAKSSGKRQWVQVRGQGSGQRWGTEHRNSYMEMCSDTDQHALTDVSCRPSLVLGAGYAGPAPALSLGQLRDSVGKRWGPGEP